MMKKHLYSIIAALAFSFSITASGVISTASASSPVVVELYTSQGCESCPPAEAFLKELSNRDDLITLEFHIDYWDYIGWADPFANPDYTRRQKNYAAVMEERYVYTPQMVFNGRVHEVGSKRSKVNAVISRLQNETPVVAPDLSIISQDKWVKISVGDGNAPKGGYNIVLAAFDAEHRTEVTRGENRGEELINTNVVRNLTVLGQWDGTATMKTTSILAGDGGCVVMLQHPQTHEIIAAAKVQF